MSTKTELLQKIEGRQAIVGIVGMGYVGLPLAIAFAEAGFSIVGLDVSQPKIDALNVGESYIEDVPTHVLKPFVDKGQLRATTSYADLADVDAICICVPTPLLKNRDPDISYVEQAAQGVAPYIQGKLIALESTIYPGGTEDGMLTYFGQNGEVLGKDYFVNFSPERIDPGRTDYTIATTPKIVGGATANCLEVGMALYGSIVTEPVPVTSLVSAELVKLLENTFRMINIGLANELAIMCDKLGANVWEVIDGAATKPYGFKAFYPGPGVGGHCIPIDPHYLSWTMRGLNYSPRFIELAADINHYMPKHVVNKVADALNEDMKPLKGSKVLILGVAYKPNIGDVRESPALEIIHLLQAKGADIYYNDLHSAEFNHDGIRLVSSELTPEFLASVDCSVIVTPHTDYDWDVITAHASVIVDTRNAVKQSAGARIVGI